MPSVLESSESLVWYFLRTIFLLGLYLWLVLSHYCLSHLYLHGWFSWVSECGLSHDLGFFSTWNDSLGLSDHSSPLSLDTLGLAGPHPP